MQRVIAYFGNGLHCNIDCYHHSYDCVLLCSFETGSNVSDFTVRYGFILFFIFLWRKFHCDVFQKELSYSVCKIPWKPQTSLQSKVRNTWKIGMQTWIIDENLVKPYNIYLLLCLIWLLQKGISLKSLMTSQKSRRMILS